MENFKLPPHIKKVSDKWYSNTKTNKWIHKDHIQEFCNRYWLATERVKSNKFDKPNEAYIEKRMYYKEMKQARNRWGL